jgi:peptidyl-prolyl cis-trans isomerase A (cyclophilin A)
MANPIVQMKTELGEIKIEIYEKQAPITSNNFLRYVDNKLYDGTTFFRTVTMDNQPTKEQPTAVKILVIQGGQVDKAKEYPPIEHETTDKTGLRHLEGAISMSRMKPGSATSSFFLCIRDEPELDFGGSRNSDGMCFSAFGRVISGMEVVKKIHDQPKEGQRITPPIGIPSVSRAK